MRKVNRMKKKYANMTQSELLTSIYLSDVGRIEYFKWTRMGGYPKHKQVVNATIEAYENYLYDKLNSSWLGRLRYAEIDLMDYNGHQKQIAAFTKP